MSLSLKKLQHSGSDRSKPEDRLSKYGYFYGKYTFYELLAFTKQEAAVPANDILLLMVTDCGVKERLHRKIVFDEDISHFGAGVFYRDQTSFYTLMASVGYTRKAVSNEALDRARIEGDGLYSGDGEDQPEAQWREAESFVHSGEQVHTEAHIEQYDDSNGDLGDLVDDGSVECPAFINPKLLMKKDIRDWTKTSRKC